MKLNEHTVIKGNLVVLVPYEEFHVAKYHDWMKSEELQELTGSEPLSLEEEYRMQKSWRNDLDKCTFIILDKIIYNQTEDEISAMVGDTNIFMKNFTEPVTAEIEIMIAENSARGKGLGKEAVLLMLRYGVENLNINTYEAKIGTSNDKSISLFKRLGFEKVGESEIFQELSFQRDVSEPWIDWLRSQTQDYSKEDR